MGEWGKITSPNHVTRKYTNTILCCQTYDKTITNTIEFIENVILFSLGILLYSQRKIVSNNHKQLSWQNFIQSAFQRKNISQFLLLKSMNFKKIATTEKIAYNNLIVASYCQTISSKHI